MRDLQGAAIRARARGQVAGRLLQHAFTFQLTIVAALAESHGTPAAPRGDVAAELALVAGVFAAVQEAGAGFLATAGAAQQLELFVVVSASEWTYVGFSAGDAAAEVGLFTASTLVERVHGQREGLRAAHMGFGHCDVLDGQDFEGQR